MLSNLTGASHSLIKWAKDHGCPFDVRGRIKVGAFKNWVAANPPPATAGDGDGSKESKQLAKLTEEIRKLKIRNDRDSARLIEVAIVAADWSRRLGIMTQILRQKLENEYPALVAGLDPAKVREVGKKVVDEILTAIKEVA